MQYSPRVYAEICCNRKMHDVLYDGKKTTYHHSFADAPVSGVTLARAGEAAVDGGEAG